MIYIKFEFKYLNDSSAIASRELVMPEHSETLIAIALVSKVSVSLLWVENYSSPEVPNLFA